MISARIIMSHFDRKRTVQRSHHRMTTVDNTLLVSALRRFEAYGKASGRKRRISLCFVTNRHRRLGGLPRPSRGIRLPSQIAKPWFQCHVFLSPFIVVPQPTDLR
jgi:hypothetical protein